MEPGGHSTYQILLNEPEETAGGVSSPLVALGCDLEHFTPKLKGIDVPPESDTYAVYSALEGGMAAGSWTFDEMRVEHPT